MLYYILPYLFTSFLVINFNNESRVKGHGFWLYFILILPAFLISILKGNIGTDTYFYLGYFESLIEFGYADWSYEPGFVLLSEILAFLFGNKIVCVAFVGITTTVLFGISFSKTKEYIILFCLIIFPLFYIDITMNGLRYGLSFAIAANAIDCLKKNKLKLFWVLFLCSISIQYSSILIMAVFLIDRIKTMRFLILSIVLIIAFPILAAVFKGNFQYLLDKKDAYTEIYSPTITSGLAPLLIFFTLLLIYMKYVDKTKLSKSFYLLIFLEIVSFILAKYTWAGLRFQILFLFCLILYIKENYHIKNSISFANAIIIVSVMSFLFTIKNIDQSSQSDRLDYEYPYVPYKFYWEN